MTQCASLSCLHCGSRCPTVARMLTPEERLRLGDRIRERTAWSKSARLRGLPEAKRDEMGREFIAGATVLDLAKDFRLHPRSVYEHLKRLALGI